MTTIIEEAKQKGTYEENAELDPLTQNAKSSVKIKHTTRGNTWEIKVVSGEEHLIEEIGKKALEQHNYIQTQLNKLQEEK